MRDVELLDRLAPPTEETGDWEAVLREAGVRRRRRALPVAATLAVAAALAAVVALWPAGGRHGVLDRALAAIGDGPVIHVVYRDEVAEQVVDLSTGASTPLAYEHEQWYDPARGLREVERFDGRVVARWVHGPTQVSEHDRRTLSGLLDGYREALRAGTARVVGEATLGRRRVYWIHLKGELLPDVADGKLHEWAQEVAVDAATYAPVATREARDGVPGPGTGQTILRADSVSAGSVDFTPTPTPKPTPLQLGREDTHDVAAAEAAAALGARLVWLGSEYAGHPLTRIQASTLVWGPLGEARRARGLELCYGELRSGVCDTRTALAVQESTQPSAVYGWQRDPVAVAIPPGHALVGWGGTSVFLVHDGVYVTLQGPGALQAARALRSTG